MRKVLWWLIGGSRGGRNRVRIIRALNDKPMNANQLATMLDLDYKTVRHHLDKLEENTVVMSMGDKYGKTYFLTEQMEQHLDILDDVVARADIKEEGEVDNA
jgi:DNA-binding transcriptional ArsR family regulator